MFNNGTKQIENAIGQFEKIKTDLLTGIESCKKKVSENLIKINDLTQENSVQSNAINKATRVAENIDKFILS